MVIFPLYYSKSQISLLGYKKSFSQGIKEALFKAKGQRRRERRRGIDMSTRDIKGTWSREEMSLQNSRGKMDMEMLAKVTGKQINETMSKVWDNIWENVKTWTKERDYLQGHTWSPLARSQEKLLYWLMMHFESSRNLWVEAGVHQSFKSPSLS